MATVLTINLFDQITSATARNLADQLATTPVTTPVEIRVNSPGGDLAATLAMISLLEQRPTTIKVDGIAASAASLLCCAGRCIAARNALFMIHAPWCATSGNARELREATAGLEKFEQQTVGIYARKTGKPEREIARLLDGGETWLDAHEAKRFGVCDEITEGTGAVANWGFLNPPKHLVAMAMAESSAAVEFNSSPALRQEFGTIGAYSAYRRAVTRGSVVNYQSPPMINPQLGFEAQFRASPALQAEFGDVEIYAAFRRAQQNCRLSGRGLVG